MPPLVQPPLLLPAAVLCLTLVSPRPSPNSGTGRLGKQVTTSLDSEAQVSHWWRLNTAPTTITTQSHKGFISLYRSTNSKTKHSRKYQILLGKLTLRGFSLRYGGSPSTISIAMIPRDQMSTFGPYAFLVTTSGAIQYGVPTMVLRLLCSGVIWAQKPKSAVDSETISWLFSRNRKEKQRAIQSDVQVCFVSY